MINAKELRLGNYVSHLGVKKVYAVQRLVNDSYCIIDHDKDCAPNCDNIEPIPLTEDWLEKFGFEQNEVWGSGWHLPNMEVQIGSEFRCFYMDSVDDVSVKYVHQLQNLYFALTGEELTIKQQ